MLATPTPTKPAFVIPPLDPAGQQRQLFRKREKKIFSQFNEDGILELIFERIGPGQKRFVEFGVANGIECNTANLSLSHGWSGLLLEGNSRDAAKATAYYNSRPQLQPGQVKVVEAFITAGNIDDLIAGNLPAPADDRSLDLLSIDIDGNDAWVWRAITSVQPRVVVIEYNAAFGFERSITIPYTPDFERFTAHTSGMYCGVSLAGVARIGNEKGYALIACESHGVNAFFIRSDLLPASALIPLPPDRAYYHHAWWTDRYGQTDRQFERISQMPFVKI